MTDKLDPQIRIMARVYNHRKFQDAQWGGPTHDDMHSVFDWTSFMGHQVDLMFEYLGANQLYGYKDQEESFKEFCANPVHAKQLIERFEKIAALSIAAIESLERKSENWQGGER
jgi:hypothetical protein